MKKIKLLTPLITIATATSAIIPIASCSCSSNEYIKTGKSFEKKQTIDAYASYIFVLDKDTYTSKDITLKLSGTGSDNFLISSIISNNLLVVNLTPINQPDEGSVEYKLNLNVKVGEHSKDFTNLIIIVLPEPDVPTVDSHLEYTFHSNGSSSYYSVKCNLKYYEKATWDVKTLYLPETYDDGSNGKWPVAEIESYGFYNCTTIKKLIIPNTIKTIGSCAFYCSDYIESEKHGTLETCAGQIKKVEFLGNSQLQTIESCAFYGQNQLTEITIPKSVKTLGSACFACVEEPYSYMLSDSDYLISKGSLQKITFEQDSQITQIDERCFRGQNQLTEITIPKSVSSLGADCFECYDVVPNEYSICTGSLENVTIEQGSQELWIRENCFRGQSKLKSIDIPDNVDLISDNAFYCFDITYTYNNSEYKVVAKPTGSLQKVTFGTDSILNNIGPGAFYGQKELTSFTLPNKVEQINEFAFASYEYEYNSATGLYNYSAAGKLSNFKIDKYNSALAIMEKGAFAGQKELTSINIPGSFEFFGDYNYSDPYYEKLFDDGICFAANPFYMCDNLKTFDVNENNQYVWTENNQSMLFGYSDIDYMTGQYPTLIACPTAKGEIDLSGYNVERIGLGAFSFNKNITSINLDNDNIKAIASGAFNCCENLKQLNLGASLEYINPCAFNYFKWYETNEYYDIPINTTSKLTKIEVNWQNKNYSSTGAFTDTPLLIYQNDDLEEFKNQKALWAYPSATGDVDLDSLWYEDITMINDFAFAVSNLKSFKPHTNTTTINSFAFQSCKKLESLDLNMVTELKSQALEDCHLKKISAHSNNPKFQTLKDGMLLKKDGSDLVLVMYLDSLGKDIDFKNTNITIIGADAFGVYKLDSINLISLDGVKKLEWACFADKNFENSNITIPESMTEIEGYAFSYATGIDTITFTNTTGWKVMSWETGIDVTDPDNNARQLLYGNDWRTEGIHK